MRYQPIYDIAELCALKNIKHVVLCPGSRCAPLTIAFTRHPGLDTKTFSDERSAGFVALGMAQATRSPVVLLCTSGTAAYNLAPALAEAHFSQTPLVVITADRPAEWIGQHDGQTVYQTEMFGRHVKKFFQLPQDYDHADSVWAINRIVNEALNLSIQHPSGPVHINAPFREPLYPEKGTVISFSENVRVIEEHRPLPVLDEDQRVKIKNAWLQYDHVLLVAGQNSGDTINTSLVSTLQRKHFVPVVHDIISNLHAAEGTVQHADLFLGQAPDDIKEILMPDLLITFGQSLISKNLKIFLRKYQPKAHWHIQYPGPLSDTFKNVTEIFSTGPDSFLSFLNSLEEKMNVSQNQGNYFQSWQLEESRTLRAMEFLVSEPEVTELQMVKTMLSALPAEANLHLANSMSVRYGNFIGLPPGRKGINVFSNRGTSGIDGCTSTAVGHCLTSPKPNFLITGDLAFFYDRNAFWHNYPLQNLRILLLNNHGGLIFDVLEGPSSLPEAKEFFITRQMLNGLKLCEEFGFEYLTLNNKRNIQNVFRDFFAFNNKTKILEIETDTSTSKNVLEMLKLKIKTTYEL